eukprot:CAMPEP_0170170502 /NCGR_PEP_ID=MMETSP0040_2-20121228/3501_1 /TAXON_ID=641309 /ORGANISM="Lotharella oceanica, Strain CCMP622" /LENGTH=80 /DNA_ID=CAMNT_0010409951 /DNA_START=83 /DNA_END=325 /DNA_ORIENTATION=+
MPLQQEHEMQDGPPARRGIQAPEVEPLNEHPGENADDKKTAHGYACQLLVWQALPPIDDWKACRTRRSHRWSGFLLGAST